MDMDDERNQLPDERRLPEEKAIACLQHLVEGCSVRSTERITGVHRDTIISLMLEVGEKCERLMDERIVDVPVHDVQLDELWGFVFCKEKSKERLGITDDQLGDAWCFVGIERDTKLVLAWHLGQRTGNDALIFTEKLATATSGRFQVTSDGLRAYLKAVDLSLGDRVDFAQLVKVYGSSDDVDHRYSPSMIKGIVKSVISGNPDTDRICTSHVERQNLTLRTFIRRLTRLTCAFSKSWDSLKAAYALHFAHYNFCRKHSTIKTTPAVAAGITDHVWTLQELLTA